MKALTWHAAKDVRVVEVPDPAIVDPTDVVIRVTAAAICGSDLHLYDVLGPFLHRGDILGHETMGVVEEVGADVRRISVGDRVVIPFVISCGHCFMCARGLTTQCETTQNRAHGTGAELYGYTELYGEIPGGQAEYLRVRRADANAQVVGHDLPDERYLFLSDILPTAWQGFRYAGVPPGGTLAVLGLGPVGQLVTRIARHHDVHVHAVDPVPERRLMAERYGATVHDLGGEAAEAIRDATEGRGPDAVVDAVGLEAHGNPGTAFAQSAVGVLPDSLAKPIMTKAGVDRLAALHFAIELVRRGGAVSVSGVYAGSLDPMPMMTIFDKQLTMRFGQCNVHQWLPELLPLAEGSADPLGLEDLATHRVPLEQAPEMYEKFRNKEDGCIKVVLKP
ncbi:threonine dehydrogenase-like Zn-dependent dehydrogenase [Agromyces ramosus]|jgi:threonine dehydrogenase-like Zn-dependent dehydrogenase|uniref:Threonine dehydrogenase-like Zn-dependent dehydrogenase n=1 Tax=Agromyces ramosus TaxID=33879 RepID=A0A4Q7MKC1_9MICO|nr:alcohol dehydrogenase catalytic domain-containing protein [Agromyces ramosus]RZS68726.1 threonine dehydrogenase-like Zn-dependent dehydrogenase [Agromyces ramosus]